MIIDMADSAPYRTIARLISLAGQKDSSGLRRHLVGALGRREYTDIRRLLRCDFLTTTLEESRALLVQAWGKPDEQRTS